METMGHLLSALICFVVGAINIPMAAGCSSWWARIPNLAALAICWGLGCVPLAVAIGWLSFERVAAIVHSLGF